MDDDLYKEIILDHTQHPRGKNPVECPTHSHQGYNPLCGDEVELQLQVVDDRIAAVGFQGSGCSISQASASMLTEQLLGKTLMEADQVARDFRGWMMDRQAPECPEGLGDLEAFSGVRSYPVRIKCALLAWSTLEQALSSTAG